MPKLDISSFNKACMLGGGFVISFGLVSLVVTESLYLSESFIALGTGAFWSRSVYLGLVKPLIDANVETIENFTRNLTRLVLGIQLVIVGVQLPSKYLLLERKSLAMLLGPVMTCMWIMSSIIVWIFVPQMTMLGALAISACIAPTDPVLANSIVKGRFADKFIAPRLQNIIIAESGANDGLGYSFLFLALYLIEYGDNPLGALSIWFSDTILYVIGLSVVYGIFIGWLGLKMLRWAIKKKWVGRESFLVFAMALGFFIVGTCGMAGGDDVLACFVAGNVFTLDDWYRLETKDDHLAPTVDLLLNLTAFSYFGLIIPWGSFLENTALLSLPKLVCMSLALLVLRRLPAVLLTHKFIPAIHTWQHAVFAGYFGPIGVSAVFYLTVLSEYTRGLQRDGVSGDFMTKLQETATLVVWFMVVSSVFVHGITVPLIVVCVHAPFFGP
ncbi:Na/H antiporter [Morchella conica CCBAS932]|uniref:Na/H antiporter n=1 Tax=Morchella conica CCBAS932 TaxID=1392247 RepID=A0A3N4LF38_9PEZI|nr:Na/H antiporter [Morchella conica CCBAS932]